MFGPESKAKLKELFVYVAEEELHIEKLRQVLCENQEFEPYTAFKRIDRESTGLLNKKSLC